MAGGAGTSKGKGGLQSSIGTQGSRGGGATKKTMASQNTGGSQQHPGKPF